MKGLIFHSEIVYPSLQREKKLMAVDVDEEDR